MLASSMALALLIINVIGVNASAFKPWSPNNAKERYLSGIMSKARRLENNDNNNNNQNQYMPDLKQYNLVFEKCQFMRYYADQCEESSGTCLSTGSFALFRLCPSCDSCSYNYGEYMVGLDDYLQYTTAYFQEKQEEECQYCAANCYYQNNYGYVAQGDDAGQQENDGNNEEVNQDGDQEQNQAEANGDADNVENEQNQAEANGDADNVENEQNQVNQDRRLEYYDTSAYDCETCQSNCNKWNNMEANGYVQATQYLGCVKLYQDYYGQIFYAGAMCGNSDGNKVKIGVFKDANCAIPTDLDIETYVNLAANQGRQLNNNNNQNNGIKVSHSILKHVYSSGNCIACASQNVQNDANGYYQNDNQVVDVCQNLYSQAAKCESAHGFDKNQYLSYNQQAQEQTVCTLINQLKGGTYDAISGEINLSGKSKTISSSRATGGQKFALTVFILSTCGLAVYAAMLHQKLVKGGPGRLNPSHGAMA